MKLTNLNDLPYTASYLSRINAEPRSLKKAVVREEGGFGYWRDVAIIQFNKKGEIEAPIGYEPTTEEQERIIEEFGKIDWPDAVFIDINDKDIPSMFSEAPEKNQFVFKNEQGKIVMLQVRLDKRDGKKAYVPITKWSDGEFRYLEPEGKLPLFGLENIKDNTTVLIVEGAKTAKYIQWLSDAKTAEAKKARDEHPWGAELSNLCVLGWCAGALSPGRCDWSPIRDNGITRAYVALDQDQPGREALPKIAKALRCVTMSIEFTDDWDAGSDLFDPFPEKFFRNIEGKRYYVGPTFHDCVHPATWMTDVLPMPDDPKKSYVALRPNARGLWQYLTEVESFVYVDKPELVFKADPLNALLRPFSDSKKTSELILSTFNGNVSKFDYIPSTKKRRVLRDGKTVINLYSPSNITPKEGDEKPWLDYLENVFPDEKERHQLKRWIATLYARPEVRIIYALLLVSETTGSGKSTLGNILSRLIGMHNSSFPNEATITEQYNAWIAQRRLVVVNEIYSGHSFKVFNKLKDLITEPVITLRAMYRDSVSISNWAHFVMCSNSFAALKVDANDRRIFAPKVTEKRMSDDYWNEFYDWLDSGGIQIIANWCMNFGDYVKYGEKAPMTETKKLMIEEMKSEHLIRVEELAQAMNDASIPIVVGDKDIFKWTEAVVGTKGFERYTQLKSAMRSFGTITDLPSGFVGKDNRISISSRPQNIVMNKLAFDIVSEIDDIDTRRERLRSFVKQPNYVICGE